MRSWHFLSPLGLGFRSLFLLWYTLPLLCVSPFCCPFIRLSPGFLFLLLSFAAVALFGRFRLRSRDRFFSHSFFLPFYLYFLMAFPMLLSPCFSLLWVFASSFRSVFSLSIVCVPGCVSIPTALFFFSLFVSFLLLRGLTAFPKLRLLHLCFSWGFLFFTGFLFGSSPMSSGGVPVWLGRSFQLTLLRC